MLSQTGGVKLEVSFTSHASRMKAEGERTEVNLKRKQRAAGRKHCSSSACSKLGVASCARKQMTNKRSNKQKASIRMRRDDIPSALPPALPHYTTRLQLRLVFYCFCVPRTSETEYLFLKTRSITSSNSSCWR